MLFNVSLGVKQRIRGRNFTNEYLLVASCFLVFCVNLRKKALKNFAEGLQVDFFKFERYFENYMEICGIYLLQNIC
jgi:hypothetical protein